MATWASSTEQPIVIERSRSRSGSRSMTRGVGNGVGSPARPLISLETKTTLPDNIVAANPSSYSKDQSRIEWEAYERDRAAQWAAYERDRAAYEYSRRGRSPMADDGYARKRGRSNSPYGRDGRYEPRPRYNDDHDSHARGHEYERRGGGHWSGGGGYRGSARAPPDPHTFPYPASLKQYADWFRYNYPQQATDEDNADKLAEQAAGDGTKPRNGIRSRWEKYKKEFGANQLQTLFEHHRKSPWFSEKYDPSPKFQALRKRVRKEGWNGRLQTFIFELESGKFDPEVSNTETTQPGSPNKEDGLDVERILKSSADGSPAVETRKAEDDMQFNVEADDDVGDADAIRIENNGKIQDDSRRPLRGDEVSAPPEGNQVMIRTIPPDIGRVKLEDAIGSIPDFMYLALGDPMQKRNYYRAGWIRFADDADMTTIMTQLSEKKIEGFRLHVTHCVRPFVTRIRFAPECSSRPDRLQKDLVQAKRLACVLEEQAAVLQQVEKSDSSADVVMFGVDTTSKDQSLDDPNANMKSEVSKGESNESGSMAVERQIEKVIGNLVHGGSIDPAQENKWLCRKTEISLDFYLAYLRSAFNTCYYCAVTTDHLEELQRKCLKHVRKPLTQPVTELNELEIAAEHVSPETEANVREDGSVKATTTSSADVEMTLEDKTNGDIEKSAKAKDDARVKDNVNDAKDFRRNDDRWLEWLDSKIALLIDPLSVDPREYGGKSYDDELTKGVEPHIKQEDEGKFRCKTCQKLFKATTFLEKHITNKHPELVKHLDDLPYFNNFALDPHHIQPVNHAQSVSGSTQGNPPQAWGGQGKSYGGGGGVDQHRNYDRAGSMHNSNGGFPDTYGYSQHGYSMSGGARQESYGVGGGRLSERISGYAPPGLDRPLAESIARSGRPSSDTVARRGVRSSGPPPPPPPNAKEDPRAAAGKKLSYYDMDSVAEGDVELSY